MRSVSVSLNKITYHIALRSKYIILTGNSAIGKTTLYKVISDVNSVKSDDIEFFEITNQPISAIINFLDVISKSRNGNVVFYCDDDKNDILSNKELQDAIAKTDAYFLLITREPLWWIPYSIDDVCTIESVSRYNNKVVPMYKEMYRKLKCSRKEV